MTYRTFLDESPETQRQIAAALYDLFAGRLDVYAIRVENREGAAYYPSRYEGDSEHVHRVVNKTTKRLGSQDFTEEVMLGHITGKAFLGVYPIQADSTVRWFALDFDRKKEDDPDPWPMALRQAEILIKEAQLPVYIERSQSGKGFHVWGFIDGEINAGTLRHALAPFIEDVETYDRMFPNQNGVTELRPLGNLIALPFFPDRMGRGNACFVRRGKDGNAEVIPDQLKYLRKIKLISTEHIEKLFEEAGPYIEEREHTKYQGNPEGLGKSYKLTHPVYGCEWVRWCWDHPEEVSETQWHALACNFAQLEDGRELFHRWSERDEERYSPIETDKKYDHALRQNKPHGCETIRQIGGNCYCDERFPAKVYHPFDLVKLPFKALVDSISTEDAEDQIWSSREGFEDALNWAQQVQDDPTLGQGLPYGIKPIDKITGLRDSDLITVAARPGMGKAQPLDAKVLTPSGWKRMGDIKVGDFVIGADGAPTAVLGVYPQGEKDTYEVVFDDGGKTECCDEHLWLTRTRADRRVGAPGTVKTLKDIASTLRVSTDNRKNHSIPWMAPAQFTKKSLPLHPYVLGVYLGDGSCNDRLYRIHNPESDVVRRVGELLPDGDYLSSHCDGLTWGVCKHGSGRAETAVVLEELGLAGCDAESKFIPESYLLSSVDDRLELLRGLMDTDGYVCANQGKPSCTLEFVTVSRRLADAVCFLVRSLGGRVSVEEKLPSYTYNGRKYVGKKAYRLHFSFASDLVPVSSQKHLSRFGLPRRRLERFITDVRYVGKKPMQCLYVASDDHLYVTDDFIVTHNTAFMCTVVDNLAIQGVSQIVFSIEMTKNQFFRRLLSTRAGVDATRLSLGRLTKEDWKKLNAVRSYITDPKTYPVFVDDTTAATDRMFEVASELIAQYGKGVIWVDYLQLMQRQPKESVVEAISRNIQDLKKLGKALGVPVVVLVQLNRSADDATAESETYDSWLKGSSDIEQASDVIWFILGEKGPGVKERIAVKHKDRHREAGHRVELEFNQGLMRFAEPGSWGITYLRPSGDGEVPAVDEETSHTADAGTYTRDMLNDPSFLAGL